MEEKPILQDLWDQHYAKVDELFDAQENVENARIQIKSLTEKLRKAKSGLYQACKIRTQTKNDIASTKRRAQGYGSYKRAWAKKNMGKIIDEMVVEEDL